MKSIFMRVLFCKIHCPSFICFCKPSAANHLYNRGPLKLESSPHDPTSSVVTDAPDHNHISRSVEEAIEVKEEEILEDGKQEPEGTILRSCIKNKANTQLRSPTSVQRKKVQWLDNVGKELVDIKEFESSETGDTDNEEDGRGCLCTIL